MQMRDGGKKRRHFTCKMNYTAGCRHVSMVAH